MSDDRARRVGLNEALFRHVNEEIESLNDTLGVSRTLSVICECADGDCTEQLEIPVEDYERVRADPRHFVVVPGHEIPEFESVVEQREGYDVVRKDGGTPAQVAEETDPRT